MEGGTSPEEMMYLANIIALTDARHIAEIGLNAGYSAHAMLSERLDVRVVSFDIGSHTYINTAKLLLDDMYKDRHKLIIGNSMESVPDFCYSYPTTKFDMAFIDGGHSYKTAIADIVNMRNICKKGAFIIMDDVTPFRNYGRGPFKAWNDAIQEGVVEHVEFIQDGERVISPDPAGTHVWAAGVYKMRGK
jgi:predicted O-methyltransferase YrrM